MRLGWLIWTLHPPSIPICANCRHCRIDEHGAVCQMFGNLHPVSGRIHYTSCTIARRNESMCGLEGRFFYHYLQASEDEDNVSEDNDA